MSQKRGKQRGQNGGAARQTLNSSPNGRGSTKKGGKQTARKDEGRDREGAIKKIFDLAKNPNKIKNIPIPPLKRTPPQYHKLTAQIVREAKGDDKRL